MSTVTTSDWSQFCDGLAYAGNRDMSPAERSVVAARARWLLSLAAATLIVTWGIAIGIALIAYAGSLPGGRAGGALAAMAGIVLVAVGILLCLDLSRYGRALRLDVSGNVIARYTSLPSSKRNRELEILPHSHRNWAAVGTDAQRWKKAPTLKEPRQPQFNPFTEMWVVPSVCYAARVARLPGWYSGASPTAELRELPPDELKALRDIIHSYRWRSIAWFAVFITWLISAAFHVSTRVKDPADLFPGILVFFAAMEPRTVMGIHRRDLKAANVVATRWSPDGTGDLSPVIEYLPASHVIWSIDGQPADWRSKVWWRLHSPALTSTAESF